MKTRAAIFILLIISSFSFILSSVFGGASGQELLVDDATTEGDGTGDYEFKVLTNEYAVVGIRAERVNNNDIEIYEDTIYSALIESSESEGNAVNFVVLDDTPPHLRANISTNQDGYTMELENEIERRLAGVSWAGIMNKPLGGPVLNFGSPGSLDDEGVYGPTVVYVDYEYRIWYTGNDGSSSQIFYATSDDGIHWDKRSEPVLTPSNEKYWEIKGVSDPSVLYDGETYYMWYAGDEGNIHQIGYATSDNGIDWEKWPSNPVFRNDSPSTWDDGGVSQPSVIYDDGEPVNKYKMWYAAYDGSNHRIGYSTSPDGTIWNTPRFVIVPALDTTHETSWENDNVYEPSVILKGSTFHMWYGGDQNNTARIGYANSTNGIMWTRYEKNPVLDIGPKGTWDDKNLKGHAVVNAESSYHMWYSGYDGRDIRIGYASSKDGSSWAKFESSPEVLDSYVVTNIIKDLTYSIELDVPDAVDLDMFIFHKTGGRDDALAASIKSGAGVRESLTFRAPISGDYVLVVTNENRETGMYTVLTKSPPVTNINGNLNADESGCVSLETEVYYPGLTEDSTQYPVRSVDISADGSYLVVGWESYITFFNTMSNIPLWTLDTNEYVYELKLSDNGQHLAAFCGQTVYFFHTESSIPLWSVDTGYRGSIDPVNLLDMTRDARFIAIKVWGNRVLVYETASSSKSADLYWDYDFGDEIFVIKFSGNGEYLAMGSAHDHQFRLARVHDTSILWTHTTNDVIYSASLSFDGSKISNGLGIGNNVNLFESTSSNPQWSYELNGSQYEQAMSDDGEYFVSSNRMDGTTNSWSGFALWNTGDSEPIWEYPTSYDPGSWADAVDMDREAKYVVGGCRLNNVYLFNQFADESLGWSDSEEDSNPVFTYPTGGKIGYNSVSISANGTYFAAGSYDGSIYLFTTVGKPHPVWSWNSSSPSVVSWNYSWDFGDGTTGIGENVTHIYTENGNYTVILTLKAEDGTVHIYTMFVVVDKEDSDGLLENLLKPGLPLAAVAIMVALLASIYAGRTEVGKYKLIPLIFPLYTRLKKEEVLDHFMRGRIYEHIRKNPGDHYNSIKLELELSNGILVYHLRTLEKHDMIYSKRDGRYKRFYHRGVKPDKIPLLTSIQGDILKTIYDTPGISSAELAFIFDRDRQDIYHNVKVLAKKGLIDIEKDRGRTHIYVNEAILDEEE
jgi:predicted GH43/DUF377 family glycosyl hydrolase/DNA-binding MarR family transcriptional regulator